MVFGNPLARRRWSRIMLTSAVMTCLGTVPGSAAEPSRFWVFVGTFTDGASKGIYRVVFDSATGKLSEPTLAAELDNPNFLAVHPTHRYLFAVNDSSNSDRSGAVTSFALDPESGELKRIGQQPAVGIGPCHLVVNAAGKNVLVANYNDGSVAVLPVGPDGKLGPASEFIRHAGKVFDPKRQGGRTPTRSTSTRTIASPWSPTSASIGFLSTSSTRSAASSRPTTRPRPRSRTAPALATSRSIPTASTRM